MNTYFIKEFDNIAGPFPAESFGATLLKADDLVLKNGETIWRKASEFTDLVPFLKTLKDSSSNFNLVFYYYLDDVDKKGPINLDELRHLKVSPNTLIWRSDSSEWSSARYFEEIKDSLFDTPPPLPQEIKKIEKAKLFEKKTLLKYYLITAFCLGIISSIIAVASYENWPGKGHENEFSSNTYLGYTLRYTDPSIGWHPYRNNEDTYAKEQLFILRPLYPFFSNAYLSTAEQDNYILVWAKQIFSSFLLLAGVFLILLAVKYFQSQQKS